ncbi:MAG: sodium:solute symporter family transporter, partial [Phocaeicola sp.]
MNKKIKIVFFLLSLLCISPTIKAGGSFLEVKTNPILERIEGNGVFLGIINENLYIGKEDFQGPDSLLYAKSIYCINSTNKKLEVVAEFENPLHKCGFTTFHQSLLLVGGETPQGASNQVYLYKEDDLSRLHTLANLPKSLISPTIGILANHLIVSGGYNKEGVNLEAWKLNLEEPNAQWKSIANLPFYNGPNSQSVVQNGGDEDLFYLFGNKTLVYSIKKNEWKEPAIKAKVAIEIHGQQPIALGTHHILFLDGQGNYCTYHTITGQWDSNGFKKEDSKTSFVAKWNNEYVMYDKGKLTQISFVDKASFGWLNYTVLLLYLALMLYIGFYFSRRAGTSEQFFKGGGKIPWWAAGISIFATTLSAITFMALPAKAYTTNWLYFPMSFSILIMAPIVAKWYLPFFRRLNLTTAYEYLEKRFNLTVRLVSSLLFILFMIIRIGIVLYLPSVALATVTGIDLLLCILMMSIVTIIYSTLGGVEAVVWGDVVQGAILVIGALVSVVYLVVGTGGFAQTISIGMSADKFRMLDFSFDFTQPTFWVIFFG